MSLISIWVDRTHAKEFQFTTTGIVHKNFEAHTHLHHTHVEGQKDHFREEIQFFKELTPGLEKASEILILGPGLAKHHFQTFLTEHHPAISKKVIACEAVDHPTDPQIIAMSKKFFSAERLTELQIK